MNDIDSLHLELAAERNNHQRDNEYYQTEVDRLRAALQTIATIEDQAFGDDYQEINEAREIARRALEPKP